MVAFFVNNLVILANITSIYALVLYQRFENEEWSFRSMFDMLRRGFTCLLCILSTTDKIQTHAAIKGPRFYLE